MTTIMLVDDSAFLRRILKGSLSKKKFVDLFPGGCTLIEAGGKAEALQKFEQEHPDLVLLDIVMDIGDRDGIDILDTIMNSGTSCPVIMMSAVGQDKIIHECLDKGAAGYVLKPFDEDQVLATIEAVLCARRQLATTNPSQ